jgi:hypothetical protein
MPSINNFTATATDICAGQSVTLNANATDAERYSFDDGLTWLNSASTVVSPSTTTTYTLKITRTEGGCTVTGTPVTITVRPTPALEFVNPFDCLVSNTSEVLTVSDKNSAATSYCFRYECANCTHNPYLTGNDEPAASNCYWFPECIYSGANTYTVYMYDAGNITVWAKAITDYGCVDSVSTNIEHAQLKATDPCIKWTCGSLVWSDALRDPAGCTRVTSLSSSTPTPAQYIDKSPANGYYYNWYCVNEYAETLCPAPWRVPTETDINNLVSRYGKSSACKDWTDAGFIIGATHHSGVGTYIYGNIKKFIGPYEYAAMFAYGATSWKITWQVPTQGNNLRCVRDL